MSHRHLTALFTVIAVVLLAPPAAAQSAQSSTPPRTPWGHPDLQGVWVNNSATRLERPDAFAGKQVLTDEELAELRQKAAEVLDVTTLSSETISSTPPWRTTSSFARLTRRRATTISSG